MLLKKQQECLLFKGLAKQGPNIVPVIIPHNNFYMDLRNSRVIILENPYDRDLQYSLSFSTYFKFHRIRKDCRKLIIDQFENAEVTGYGVKRTVISFVVYKENFVCY